MHVLAARGEDGRFEAVLKLSDDAEVRALNRQFRGQDKPTNVLSFPSGDDWPAGEDEDDGAALPLGDIIIALETVEREAAALDKPLRHHLAHLVVHGILHLFGFDHLEDEEAEEMEQLERQVLAQLGIPSPYEESPFDGM
jgi:probable rRNA maturation factor